MPLDERIVNQTEIQKITNRYQDNKIKRSEVSGKDTGEQGIQ